MINIMTTLTLIASLSMSAPTAAPMENHSLYAKSMEVISVDYDTDNVECVDSNGNKWTFVGCEDYIEGDLIAAIMDDNGTNNIYDDVIMDTQFSGYIVKH